MTDINWLVGMSVDMDGRLHRWTYKRANQLKAGDRIWTQNGAVRERSIIFMVGTMPGERGKPVKAQHMKTGNMATGVHLIFEDGAEALLHPEEQVEVFS